ncbi:oxidoreductase [Cryobacterium melibiosiphilum]|uniref:Oxidoreductase n=1 Tax=Cryobacterium melibiosiphilum TaxID=995039 RepID=A0A3A5MLH7_9MICO|nr:Gfo/Idh/MocA family oxidoreductase [Cryobacterium melibiosiphilum]RJT86926.1 oxidoreductase [Cryobacterium melibiosiphilum]
MTHEQNRTSAIRTGIIGYGLSGRVFHAPFVAAHPEFALDTIVTADAGRRGQAAAQHPSARLVNTADDLMMDAASRLDLIVIASPPATHVPLAHAALDAGLNVVIDKPFAVTAADGRELIEKAERLGLMLTVFQNRRWDGDFLTLQALIAADRLGEVRRFESRFEWFKPGQGKAWKAVATPREGGGVLYDLGAHLLDQALVLFGPVEDVYAEVLTRQPGGPADDDTFVALRHASGVHSHLWMNGLTGQKGPRFRVLGSEAAYTTWGLDTQEPVLKLGGLPTDPGFGEVPEGRWGQLGLDGALAPEPTLPGDYAAFYAGVADALLRGEPVPVDPYDPLRVIDLIERIHESTR